MAVVFHVLPGNTRDLDAMSPSELMRWYGHALEIHRAVNARS